MTSTYPEKLQPLVSYLASLTTRPEMEVLRRHMLGVNVDVAQMGDFV